MIQYEEEYASITTNHNCVCIFTGFTARTLYATGFGGVLERFRYGWFG